jgi:hypothetical protein
MAAPPPHPAFVMPANAGIQDPALGAGGSGFPHSRE